MPITSRPHITGLLIDISGNLHIDTSPTPNAVEAYQSLLSSGVPFRLCSNTSKESSASLVNKLNSMGFKVQSNLVWTSLGAVAQLLKEMDLQKPYLLLSSSAQEEIVATTRSQSYPCEAESYDSVVLGLAPSFFDYPNLNKAFRILKGETTDPSFRQKAVPLIATHKAKYIQTESSLLSLGPGPFVTALEHATGVQAIVVGKPTKNFFEAVINDFSDAEIPHASKGRIAVIGDDIEADLGEGALELNLWRILVKTGKYRVGDENRTGIVPPDEVFDSFASFIDDLLATQPSGV